MKPYIKTIFLFVLLALASLSICNAQSINFAETSLSNLKKGSKATNKAYFIYLFDNNCGECSKVEKLTFTDPAVSGVINKSILAGKINLSSEEGQKLKAKNKISFAPAFLFFDKKSKLVLQQESGISSDAMLKLLRVLYDLDIDLDAAKLSTARFNNFKEFEISAPKELSSKSDVNIKDLEVLNERLIIVPKPSNSIRLKAAKVPVLSEAILLDARNNDLKNPKQLFNTKYENEPADAALGRFGVNKDDVLDSKPEIHKVKPGKPQVRLVNSEVVHRTILHTQESYPKTISAPIKKSLAPTTSSPSSKKNRSIQFAAYNKYDDVLKGMYKMKRKVDSPLTIVEEYTHGKLMYKLIIDDQMTLSKAQSLKAAFQQKGIDCFIRATPN